MKMRIAAMCAGSPVPSVFGKGGMKAVRSIPALLMFLVAFSTLSVNRAGGTECTGDNVVSHADAQCLSFSVTVAVALGEYSTWSASTSCADYGDVELKIVMLSREGTVKTYRTLNSTTPSRTGSTLIPNNQPAGYCCKDRGDLCNRSDVVTVANCTSEFNDSDAADSCTLSGDPTVNSDHTNCTFSATCGDTSHTDVTIAYTSMDDLKYCTDTFSTAESCPGP